MISYPVIHKNDKDLVRVIYPRFDKGPWIAGGAVLQWYQDKPVGQSDIDVYFSSKKQMEKLKEKLCGKDSSGFFSIGSTHGPGYVKLETKNAISIEYKGTTVQLIIARYYDNYDDILNKFDITVCQLTTDGSEIIGGDNTFSDIKNKVLRFNFYCPAAVKRLLKYITYGYTPIPGTFDEIANINNLDENFEASEADYAL